MSYKRAEEILPGEIIELIQQYVDGQAIYIPRRPDNRKPWGAGTSARQEMHQRNQQIYAEHLMGTGVQELAETFFLSEKSIQRIIKQMRDERLG